MEIDSDMNDEMTKRERQKVRRQERLAREAHDLRRQRQRRWTRNGILAIVGVVAVGALVVNVVRDVLPVVEPEGTSDVAADERNHVEGAVEYPTAPAAGGPHAGVWQNCGYYDAPIQDENAVHSLEHGAVWLAYDPDLEEDDVAMLRDMAGGYVLVSPYETPLADAAVAASAWGKQLRLPAVDDPRLDQFVRAFEQGPQTPEPGAVCTRGIGDPV